MKLKLVTDSKEKTFDLGVKLGKKLHANSVLAFYGDLAAGKTTLIKGIASALGGIYSEEVNSPTFTYLNIYQCSSICLYHFDLYRIKEPYQFIQMGFDEYLTAGGICCIEWSERIRSYLPKERIDVLMEHQNGSRSITIESFYEEICF
ncbi:MAG: tRNA threonylcarbamoyladenosine biosynthesis protein TsaE [Chlamydiae bacterium]|nr:tRNA threonylcarbamoyladenosine biosynthesis protein TsaE [Chlamydiota bacterium]